MDVNFDVSIVPFSRAKQDLYNGKFQLIGMTAYQAEGNEFYSRAMELDWFIPAKIDIYTMDSWQLDVKKNA